ncbi:MAG: cobalt/nickel transport system permease protein [Chloroflexota bacterium]|nr:cobalt/nickel transport system permease protein [Chloroflexota bacterium]
MPVDIELRASYESGTSLLHLCDARIKIALLAVTILTTALLPIGAWAVYVLLSGLLLVTALLSELPVKLLLKRGLLLEVPILLVLLPQIFLPGGRMLAIDFIPAFTFSLSLDRLERVVALLVRSALSLQFAVVILSVTRFEDLLAGLRALSMPRLLVAILALMWRYLFVLVEEVQTLTQARLARSSALPGSGRRSGGNLLWRARVTGGMAGTLMLRSLDRSQRVYQAMLARGYDGELRAQEASAQLTRTQIAWLVAFVLLGALLLAIAYGMAGR